MTTTAVPTTSGLDRVIVRGAALVLVVGVAVCVVALLVGGGVDTTVIAGLPNPGSGTTWGGPLATLVKQIAAVFTVGALLGATWLLPSVTGSLGRTARSLAWVACSGAVVWLVAALTVGLFTLSDGLGESVWQVLDRNVIQSYVLQTELGQTMLVEVIGTLLIAISAPWLARRGSAVFALLLALGVAAVPSFSGHSSTLGHHSFAVASLWFHLVGITLWVGGLAVLIGLAAARHPDWLRAVGRYSPIAYAAFWCVAFSGVLNAATRLSAPSELATTWYGRFVLGKAALLIVLGYFGWRWRDHAIAQLTEGEPRRFARVAWGELAFMAAAVGLAVALSRTPPPTSVVHNPRSEIPTSAPTWLHVVRLEADWLFFAWIVIAAVLYAVGLAAYRKRVGHWPLGRSISWFIGLLLVYAVTCTGAATYANYLFSMHMAQHMFLTMVAPILLVLGSPATLAIETLRAGKEEARDVAALVEEAMLSSVMRVLTNPVVALVFFAASTYVLYFTSLFGWAMSNHLGHTLMLLHFLIAGWIFYLVVIGIDPIPKRPGAPGRIAMLVASMPVHAVFGVSVLSAKHILGENYYGSLGLPWQVNLVHDQAIGGGLAWVFGEIPFVAVLGVVFVQWIRSEEREAAHVDEAAGSGDEDDQLAAYNEYLARLNRRSESD